MPLIADVLSILRFHILLIAMVAALVFAWLLTGRHHVDAALVCGADWLLINLVNRVTDLDEDLANRIRGTERIARRKGAFTLATFVAMGLSFALTHALVPALTPLRLVVQGIGLGYSYRIIPTRKGLRRIKDLYFWKNFMSAVLMVLTIFVYPLALEGYAVRAPQGLALALFLGAFFLAFEITYEIIYDLRDIDGDRLAGVPTYPVVHGALAARRIVDALLALSAAILLAGLLAGALGVREGLLLAAPAAQLALYRPSFARGVTPADCIRITHAGTGLLLLYLGGTQAWLAAGLPANIFLR